MERGVLKGYTKNLHRPEALIVERYVAEECIEFCSQYIKGGKAVGLPETRHGQTPGVRVHEDSMLSQ